MAGGVRDQIVNLLLDTQALLWWRHGARKLGARARAAIARDATDVRVSAASAWEIATKFYAGRLTLPAPAEAWMFAALDDSGFRPLVITVEHAVAAGALPPVHGDPFDRMLIAQAQLERLTIVTSDAVFDAYDVKVLDARR
jgi:PIN domain nuclease of toxin-antitoxin system